MCVRNQNLCLQIEEKQSKEFKDNKIKPLKIQMQNDKAVLVPRERKNLECGYLVKLKNKKINELFFQEKRNVVIQ